MKQVREEMELDRTANVQKLEGVAMCHSNTYVLSEEKDAHIGDLMRKNDKAFTDIKAYYTDIFLNNSDLIKSLKAFFL